MEEPQYERRRSPSLVGPLILIGLGVLFLLNTLGVLPWGIWATLWRLWPVILILIGVDLLFGRSYPWLSAAVAVVMIVGVIGVLLVGGPALAANNNWGWRPVAERVEQNVAVPLDGAAQATLNLQFGAGRLNIDALNGSGANVVEAQLQHYRGPDGVQSRIDRQGDRVTVNLEGREGGFTFPGGTREGEVWQLRVNNSVPLNLRVQGGAADADLDLRSLLVRDLSIDMGASSVRVHLPENAGETTARIKAGAADVRIDVPEGVAARISSQGGLSSINVDERRFPRVGDDYISPDFDTAQNRVQMSIDAGAASIRVR
jgi:hypothetical protein